MLIHYKTIVNLKGQVLFSVSLLYWAFLTFCKHHLSRYYESHFLCTYDCIETHTSKTNLYHLRNLIHLEVLRGNILSSKAFFHPKMSIIISWRNLTCIDFFSVIKPYKSHTYFYLTLPD